MTLATGTPLTYDFGEDFNYGSWDENTVLTLVNVPWNNDYRDIVRFSSRTARDNWIDDSPSALPIPNVSLQKFAQNVQIDLPLNAAMQYNYLRASNPLMENVSGDTQRNYYYFITGVTYLAPNTTELTLQLDVWQTFGYEVSFGSCYVERGHIGIANENSFQSYGRSFLAEPEGLDVGSEYRVVHVESQEVMSAVSSDAQASAILLCCTVSLGADDADYGTKDDPQLASASGSMFQGIPSGAEFYLLKNGQDFLNWLSLMRDKPWITQGIVSVTMIPNPTRYYPTWDWDTHQVTGSAYLYYPPAFGFHRPTPKTTALASNWRSLDFLANVLGTRYAMLKKFLTYPYLVIELTTFTGSPIIIKPEMWQDADATVKEYVALTPPGQRVVIAPDGYNASSHADSSDNSFLGEDDGGEFINKAVTISGFPQLPIVNNSGIAYLAQNRNSLNFQERAADWSQQRALRGAGVQAAQATGGIGLAQNLTDVSTGARRQVTDIATQAVGMHAFVNGGMGAVTGGPAGVTGAIAGGSNAAITAATMAETTRIANQAAQTSTGMSNAQREYVRDTNLDMAQFAARGDYENTIAGINAKIQDAALMQPSVAGQFGGDAFNLVNDLVGYSARWKMPNISTLRAIGDYWLRYGYSIRQFLPIPANMQVMTKFTYWKLSETYISQGAFPEGFRQIIRGIFEKGVTVWSDPNDIGAIDWADNEPLTGISY
jgi:hypothetical protein